MALMIPVSWGELLDKLTILLIKKDRIDSEGKLENINKEYEKLEGIRREQCQQIPGLDELVAELRLVNEKLWDIEDEIRSCEKEKEYGSRFVELARSVYLTNDRRSELKYRINILLGSELIEEKSYEDY